MVDLRIDMVWTTCQNDTASTGFLHIFEDFFTLFHHFQTGHFLLFPGIGDSLAHFGFWDQGDTSQSENVDKQVYALWNVLQKRNFKYSSTTNSSLSSNVVYTQRVRTLDDALESSQINCVDGSVLLASLLKAININPILVRIPGHMFVGYYTDKTHTDMNFLETTMIGDVNLDDFFPDEKLDSTMVGKSQNQMSKLTFEKSKEYANKKYRENESLIHSGKVNYMFLEIDKKTRAQVQPIGK